MAETVWVTSDSVHREYFLNTTLISVQGVFFRNALLKLSTNISLARWISDGKEKSQCGQ